MNRFAVTVVFVVGISLPACRAQDAVSPASAHNRK